MSEYMPPNPNRSPRRVLLAAAAAVAVLAAGGGLAWQQSHSGVHQAPTHNITVCGQTVATSDGPLDAVGQLIRFDYDGLGELGPGAEVTDGTVLLEETGSEPATLVSAKPVYCGETEVELVGISTAGSARTASYSYALIKGYPPKDTDTVSYGHLHEVKDTVVEPPVENADSTPGVQLLFGYRFSEGDYSKLPAIFLFRKYVIVDYTVGDQEYREALSQGIVICNPDPIKKKACVKQIAQMQSPNGN